MHGHRRQKSGDLFGKAEPSKKGHKNLQGAYHVPSHNLVRAAEE